jgi:transcriptional regulator with XRE-family HTH domain
MSTAHHHHGGHMPAPTSHGKVPSLRTWRVRKYWTQRQLAEHAHVAIATVAHAEQGYAISLISMQKLADVLGVTVTQLREAPQE